MVLNKNNNKSKMENPKANESPNFSLFILIVQWVVSFILY